jgi:hypothetical protein
MSFDLELWLACGCPRPLAPEELKENKRKAFWELFRDFRDFHGCSMPDVDINGDPPKNGDL